MLEKFLSREFLIACVLIGIASALIFKFPEKIDFLQWAGACGTFAGIYTTGLVSTKRAEIKAGKP